jgi:hypothetical protein
MRRAPVFRRGKAWRGVQAWHVISVQGQFNSPRLKIEVQEKTPCYFVQCLAGLYSVLKPEK